ncbi:MAG: ATP-grasp domain-containing protein [Candidatus Tectomicrobia bacterium]|uniref:ATP-grasp domain-containing protein n=1 Tax=Tectimicrobiota bacterium TaxID=2528274 RepID=A0A932I0L5_UNCTE|nr:ATP-grasp domain-containing protein [Candidatus Tectomicrobia bacterium]
MKRALLLMTTATYRAKAFLEAARAAGVRVAVGTDRPDVLGDLNPGGSLTLDFLKPEREAGAIAAFAERYPLDAIVPVDEDTTILGALAAERLGLPYHPPGAARAARSKYQLRQVLSEEGIPAPGFRLLAAEEDPARLARTVRYPCVLKPTFLSASRGVIRANDEREFEAAFRRVAAILREPGTAGRGGAEAGMILAEDYIPGIEVALEGLMIRGELHALALFDKPDPMEGPFFEETIYVTPSRLPRAKQEEIARQAGRAARALGLREGPVHAEFRLNEGGVWPLDIAGRSIGGRCSEALSFGDGLPLETLILCQALGVAPPSLEREGEASGVMMIPIPAAGVLRGVEGKEEALAVPGVRGVEIAIHAGGRVVPLPEGEKYLGFIFAKGKTPEEAEAALRRAHARLKFRIDPEDKEPEAET